MRFNNLIDLTARICRKRKKSSYQKGLYKSRKSHSTPVRSIQANGKCYTDVTEFSIPNSSQNYQF